MVLINAVKYTTIRIEGAIFSADILDRIKQADIAGQGYGTTEARKREEDDSRMSPLALLQENDNLTENLYTLVTNGFHLRFEVIGVNHITIYICLIIY